MTILTQRVSALRPLDLLRRSAVLLLALFMLAAAGCDSSEDPPTTTGSLSGRISLPAGAGGDITNTRVALFESLDEFRNNASTFSTTANANGEYSFENINPGSYFVAAFKDNNNSQVVDGGDFYGYLGGGPLEPSQATPQRQQIVAGQNTDINFVIQVVPAGFGVSLTGTYTGTTSDNEAMSLVLTESGGVVTGTGSIVGPGGAYQVSIGSITGTFNAPNLNLSLTSSDLGSPITLQGTVSEDGSTINANLNGGATGNGDFYSSDTATLTLQ